MSVMKRLRVRGKLTLAFGCVLFLMVVLGAIATLQLSRVHDQGESILQVRLAGVRDSLTMAEVSTRYRIREYRLTLTKAEEVDGVVAKLQSSRDAFEVARKSYAEAIADGTERGLYEKAMADWKTYQANTDRIVALIKAGDYDTGRVQLMGEGERLFNIANGDLKELSKYNDAQAREDAKAARGMFETARLVVIGLVAGAVAAAVVLGLVIARSIAVPLAAAVGLAESVAAGNLTRTLDSDGKDEVAQLTRALGKMVAKLREVVTEVRGGVESVSTAASQIATGNIDLSQRTEEQASNLQQTAASMEELTSTVTQNADNARAASQLANGATEVAAHGGEVVSQVVSTMDTIAGTSRRIADIIGVVDGIAFQTNILALNAAVEAARAGEQGRGFAVVAGEVRTLAQRSATAAKEIRGLIQQSVEEVDNGSRLVAQAGSTMNDVVGQVRRVQDLVNEIAAASVEQARGIEQVGDAVQQLDTVTQKNAALVEESAAAADSMRQQATSLARTVAVFDVGTRDTASGARVTAGATAPNVAKPTSMRAAPVPARAATPTAKTTPTSTPAPVPAATATRGRDDDWSSF
jgi:methyl-accepting chemotaxis protein